MIARLGLIALLLAQLACTRNAYTGRVQNITVDEDEAIERADRAAEQYRNRVRLVTDPAVLGRVGRITARLLDAAKAGPAGARAARLAWEVAVVDDAGTNVATLENGKIFLGGALVRLAASDDALAFPIAGAIAHVLLRHASERSARHFLPFSTGGSSESVPEAGSEGLTELERTQRDEADEVSLRLVIAAGYDPERAVSILDRLGEGQRAARLRERIPALRPAAADAQPRA